MTQQVAQRGPWTGGYTSSIPAFMAQPDQLVGEPNSLDAYSSRDVAVDPFTGGFSKRPGCTIVGDTVSAKQEVTGLLNAKWDARNRKMIALDSPSMADGYPALCALYSIDTHANRSTGADAGCRGTLLVESTNAGLTTAQKNYSLLEEFGSTFYNPTLTGGPFTAANYRGHVVPIWVDSGDGVYNRGALTGTSGTDKFMQQMLCPGAHSMLQTQDWLYLPGPYFTPWKWDKRLNEKPSPTTETVHIWPTGPLPFLFPPRLDSSALSVSATNPTWEDGDTFFLSAIPIFDDGSFGAPFIPRAPNGTLTNGLGMVTVGTIGGANKYQVLRYVNLPMRPPGCSGLVLLRSPKQHRTSAADTITISPLDLRVIDVIRNNTQNVYLDYQGSDVSLLTDDDVVRVDWKMPDRAAHIGTADQRAVIAKTLPSTAAIWLAPINVNGGGANNYDLNLADTDDQLYSSVTGFFVRITSTQLELHYNATAAPNFAGAGNATAFTFATYPTLGQLVDAINATTTASNCKQWGAQLAPGIDDTMPSASLTLTSFDVTGCATHTNATLDGGNFTSVGVGMKVKGTDITAGTYVLSKQSSSSITLSTAATGGHSGLTMTFYQETGDNGIVTGGTLGYMRVFGPTYPILLHMKASAFPNYNRIDNLSIYYTNASPGAAATGISLAPNAWLSGNKNQPPASFRARSKRVCQGIVDLDGAGLIAYTDGIYLLANRRGANTGEDFDLRLFTINGSRGCISSMGLVQGNGWAAYPTEDGIIVTDKNLDEFCISEAVFNPSENIGDLAYEIGVSRIAASGDFDDQRMSAGVIGTKLVIAFRRDTQDPGWLTYDFSRGIEASGVSQVFQPDTRRPYIWSPPALYNNGAGLSVPGAIGSVISSAGRTDYISFDSNLGATGDGRIDAITRTTDQDNGSTVTGVGVMAPFLSSDFMTLVPGDVWADHVTQQGSSSMTSLQFGNDQVPTFNTSLRRTMPVLSSKGRLHRQLIPIDSGQRTGTDMLWCRWLNTANTGTAPTNRLYRMSLRYTEKDSRSTDAVGA